MEDEIGLDFYLSEDIIQGESVPFFITWKKPIVKSLRFELKGFASIARFHNVANENVGRKVGKIDAGNLKVQGYLGGLLKTKSSDNPYLRAQLTVTLELKDGRMIRLSEDRTVHTTRMHIGKLPAEIALPLGNVTPIQINLKGATTVFVDIQELERSEIKLGLPKEVTSALEKFASAAVEGLQQLREWMPQHAELIDDLFIIAEKSTSLRQIFEETEARAKEAKDDPAFKEAIGAVVVSAFLTQASVRDSFFVPLMEYFEANAGVKAFLTAPFLLAEVPQGGGELACQIVAHDLLMNKCGAPLKIRSRLLSESPALVPMKDLIEVRRI